MFSPAQAKDGAVRWHGEVTWSSQEPSALQVRVGVVVVLYPVTHVPSTTELTVAGEGQLALNSLLRAGHGFAANRV